MALIALATADRVSVVESLQQMTLPAGAAVTAGAPVRIDTNGKFIPALGDDATNARMYGVATKTVASGMPVTAIRKGLMDGFTLAGAYNSAVYLSDTAGRLGDAAGTVSVEVGRVVPGTSTTLGTAADKLLLVDL